MNEVQHHKLLASIRPSRIVFPLVIGIGVVLFLFYKDYKPGAFDILHISKLTFVFLVVAVVCMMGRDVGYMIRIRLLADNKITWLQAFRIIMLWEFTSAITPSAVGGTSIAVLFVHKEGISLGHSTSIVLTTSFLDELFFVVMFPLLILIVGPYRLFDTQHTAAANTLGWSNALFMFAFTGYCVKLLYVILISYGLFVNPRGIKWLLLKILKLPWLRRWRVAANDVGSEIITTSVAFRNKPFAFWVKTFGATFLSWCSRYWVVNAIFVSFFLVHDHLLLFARQFAMWIMMLVSPTPGGSGFSEYIFTRYLGSFIPASPTDMAAIAIALAFLWRLISYYPYLVIGALILPGWIKSKFLQ